MASADAVFLAAHYRAVQRKTSESDDRPSSEQTTKRRSNSILDDIKDGVSKIASTFHDKKRSSTMSEQPVTRRRAMSEIAASGGQSRGLMEDKRRQWSIKQKSVDARIQENPEHSSSHQQHAHTYTGGKTARDLINEKRGRLYSAPVTNSLNSRPRSESDAPPNRLRKSPKETEEEGDDVFEEEDEDSINQAAPPSKVVQDKTTRL